MTLYFCIDSAGGIAFLRRRQSRDRAIINDIYSEISDALYVSEYSKKLLPDANVMDQMGQGDTFLELTEPSQYFDLYDRIVIYNFNRRYPSDVAMADSPFLYGFDLSETSEFVGTSHDRITKEVYIKCAK